MSIVSTCLRLPVRQTGQGFGGQASPKPKACEETANYTCRVAGNKPDKLRRSGIAPNAHA